MLDPPPCFAVGRRQSRSYAFASVGQRCTHPVAGKSVLERFIGPYYFLPIINLPGFVNVGLASKILDQYSLEFAPISHEGLSRVQILYVEQETDHWLCSLKNPTNHQGYSDYIDVSLHHHGHVTMFKHSDPCEHEHCHLRTQDFHPVRESEA
ncbi:hypothetical protein TNCV_1608381 [Trichonephila clavipes]|nr:hypothetical protein TNCV_1608381 [Trichonephila clavipes]